MKLDNIIYDINTLGNAIQGELINDSTTFQAMYPSQTASELVNVLAGYGSMLQYTLVSAMANCYTETAYSPTGIYQLAETLGNKLHGNISSRLKCKITRTSLNGVANTTIPSGSMFNVEGINFFNKEDIIFPRNINTINDVTLIQGTKNVTEKIASGIKGERFYFSENFECNTNEVSVTVDGQRWSIVDTFIPVNTIGVIDEGEIQVFVLGTDPDGRSYLKCGSGSNALIPSPGASIKITWISNQGSTGNITKSNAEIQLLTPIYGISNENQRELLTIDITESTPAAGGFDTQSLMTLKESSPYIFASGNRAVRRNDYKALLLNKCGYQTCNVWGEYEQAQMNGTYDKIMMNMVYYSGIKTIQKYDLQEITKPELDITKVQYNLDPTGNYYEIGGFPSSVRGFLGSYEIEFISTDDNNSPISLKYFDKFGTGILTCDYSDNKLVIGDEFEDLYLIDDLGPDVQQSIPSYFPERIINLQPLHDYGNGLVFDIHNQYCPALDSAKRDLFRTKYEKSTDYVNNHDTYLFSGQASQNISSILLPSNPIQLLFQFPMRRPIDDDDTTTENYETVDWGVISGFMFKTPGDSELLKDFIGSFAVYGSDLNNIRMDQDTHFINVKNDSSWTKLTDTITISSSLNPGDWTDWFTLNTYNPDTNKWTNYRNYLIEIYSFRDEESKNVTAGRRLAIGEIVATYGNQEKSLRKRSNDQIISTSFLSGRTSYIYYYNNNQVTLRLPYNRSNNQGIAIPSTMNLYDYDVVVEGLTVENGFTIGQVVSYLYNGYEFKIKVIDNTTGAYTVTLSKGNNITTSTLKGAISIQVEDDLDNPLVAAKHARIYINSAPCVTLYASYLGNFYSNTDIQSSDLPTIEKYNHFTTYLEFKQPRIKNIYVDLSIEFENVVTATDVKNNVITAVNKLFDITPYYLGRTFSVSDLWKAVSLVDGVKRLIVNAPTDNITALPYELISLPATNLVIRDISEYNQNTIRIKD